VRRGGLQEPVPFYFYVRLDHHFLLAKDVRTLDGQATDAESSLESGQTHLTYF
jgi:hypothetical protein